MDMIGAGVEMEDDITGGGVGMQWLGVEAVGVESFFLLSTTFLLYFDSHFLFSVTILVFWYVLDLLLDIVFPDIDSNCWTRARTEDDDEWRLLLE